MSNIQDYIEYIINKHETLTAILPIDVYTSIELIKTPETMKLFDSTKKFIE